MQVTSAPCGLGFQIPAQLGSSFFSFVNYFALAPWRGLLCLACPGIVAWLCSCRAPSLPSPAPPAALCCRHHCAGEPRRPRNLGRRGEAAGGGWRSGKGCKCEPEGEGLAVGRPRLAWPEAWGWLGLGGPFNVQSWSEAQDFCWEVRGMASGEGQPPGHLPEDTLLSWGLPTAGLPLGHLPRLAIPNLPGHLVAPRCSS